MSYWQRGWIAFYRENAGRTVAKGRAQQGKRTAIFYSSGAFLSCTTTTTTTSVFSRIRSNIYIYVLCTRRFYDDECLLFTRFVFYSYSPCFFLRFVSSAAVNRRYTTSFPLVLFVFSRTTTIIVFTLVLTRFAKTHVVYFDTALLNACAAYGFSSTRSRKYYAKVVRRFSFLYL